MAVLWIVIQLWILCCGTVVAADRLGFNALRIARFTPALAAAFLLVRVFV